MDLSDPGETKPDGQLWRGTKLELGSGWPEGPCRVSTKALVWLCRMVEERMLWPAPRLLGAEGCWAHRACNPAWVLGKLGQRPGIVIWGGSVFVGATRAVGLEGPRSVAGQVYSEFWGGAELTGIPPHGSGGR